MSEDRRVIACNYPVRARRYERRALVSVGPSLSVGVAAGTTPWCTLGPLVTKRSRRNVTNLAAIAINLSPGVTCTHEESRPKEDMEMLHQTDYATMATNTADEAERNMEPDRATVHAANALTYAVLALAATMQDVATAIRERPR